jgi:hypothetical protein
MTELASLNRDAAKQRPESVFERPLEIVNEVLFTKGEKLTALARWRLTFSTSSGRPKKRWHPRTHLRTARSIEEIEEAKSRLKKRRQPKQN